MMKLAQSAAAGLVVGVGLIAAAGAAPPDRGARLGSGTPPGPHPALRFAHGRHLFVTPPRIGPLAPVELLAVQARAVAVDPERQRVYALARAGVIHWRVAILDARRNRVLRSIPVPVEYQDDDLIRPGALAERLRNGEDSLSRLLADRLSPPDRERLGAYRGPEPPPRELVTAMTGGLNTLIGGPVLYTRERFPNLVTEQAMIADYSLTPDDRRTYNRTLLNEAFGREVPTDRWLPRLVYSPATQSVYLGNSRRFWALRDAGQSPWSAFPARLSNPRIIPGGDDLLCYEHDRDGKITGLVALDSESRAAHWRLDGAELHPERPRVGDPVLDPVRKRLYMLQGDRLLRLHSSNLRLLGRILLKPQRPGNFVSAEVCVDPRLDRLYISPGEGGGRLRVLQASTGRFLAWWQVGTAPNLTALNPATGHLFVTDALDNKLRTLDTRTGRVIGSLEFDDRPLSLTVCPELKRVYVVLDCGVVVVLSEK